MPLRQRGRTSAGGRDPPPRRAVVASAAGEPLIGRVVQALDIDAVAAVDGSQQGDDLVGRRPSGLPGDPIEAGLHVAAGDGVEGSCEPVAEIEANLVTVVPVGALLAVGIGGHVVLEGLSEGRHDARPGALADRVPAFDGAENGEEVQCAQAIDSLPGVRLWIRNAAGDSASFWLPTATGRFYPDFVARLDDDRLLVVEYKGAHIADSSDTAEKRTVGELWERNSGGGGVVRRRGENGGREGSTAAVDVEDRGCVETRPIKCSIATM